MLGSQRPTLALAVGIIALAGPIAACTAAAPGEPCVASAECASALCYANLCRDPDADDDGDGLDNRREHAIATDPDRVDSDGDGKPDGVEASPSGPAPDSDGDGKPDAIESAQADADRDCLVDERDADDHAVNGDPALLARDACPALGVCAKAREAIGATCKVGEGILRCDFSAVPGYAATERCDGVDDDCDGLTDEGFTWQGVPVGAVCDGVGLCGAGTVVCSGGAATCSTQPGQPDSQGQAEACNGADDDCDGFTDEDFTVGGAAVGAPCLGTGTCGYGVVACSATGVARCSSDPGGADDNSGDERCNGLDDDCDGATDDGLHLEGVVLGGACIAAGICGPGTVVCSSVGEVTCSSAADGPASAAQAESCNGLDDDCDGETDEGLFYKGKALGFSCQGVGDCGAGTVVCSVEGKATCSSLPDASDQAPPVETCDGLDNDCDGQTDEGMQWQGLALGAPCQGVGACTSGTVQCALGAAVPTCSSLANGWESQANPETCNNKDDDCDGLTDDDADATGVPPCVGQGLCVGVSGQAVCTSGAWGCVWPTVAGWQSPDESTCDGKDNDCDGLIDEGLPKQWAQAPTLADAGAPAPRVDAAITGAGADVFVAGGSVGVGAGALALDAGLWRLQVASGRWTRAASSQLIARRKAALAWLPPGWVASGPRLWLLGGLDATGAPASASIAIDPIAGTALPLAANAAPAPRVGAAAVVDAAVGHLWLLGGVVGGAGAAVQRFDAAVGQWAPPATLPQLTDAGGPATACLGVDGARWWLAASASGARSWHRLAPAGDAWQPRAAPPPAALGGTVVCDVIPGEHWLIGAAAPDGKPAGTWRYAVASDAWSQPTVATGPTRAAPLVAATSAGLVLAFGADAQGRWAPEVWRGPQPWVIVGQAPQSAVGARHVVGPDGQVWSVGGANLRGPTLLPAAAHRLAPDGWHTLGDGALVLGRAWPLAAADPAGGRLWVWGGVALPSEGTETLGPPAGPAAAGAWQIGANGVVAALTPQAAAWLPQLPASTVSTPDAAGSSLHWLLGVSGPSGAAAVELWRLDAAKAASQMVHAVQVGADGWPHAAALVRVGPGDAVRTVDSAAGLRIRRWQPGAAWQTEFVEPSVVAKEVEVAGRPGGEEFLLLFPSTAGSAPMLRRLERSKGTFVVSDGPAWPPAWTSGPQALWPTAPAAVALVAPGWVGLPSASAWTWPLLCAPP